MSRVIKFRAWDDKLSVMMFFDLSNSMHAHALGLKIEQFTGLHDKNGVEIYEGDMVRISGVGEMLIEWPFSELYDASFEGDIGEISGNIYENPELLGVSPA